MLTAQLHRLALASAFVSALASGCSKDKSSGPSKQEVEANVRAEPQAQGLANANAMIDNAKLCEPEQGAPSLDACQRACELNHSNSCANWAALAEASRALSLFERACRGGSGIGCEGQARLVEGAGDRATQIYLDARRYHRIHCSQGYPRSCEQLAGLFETAKGGKAMPAAAKSFRSRACSLGRKSSCLPH
ncbi:MAG: sel1 repeat family protein [Myxococcales bacterium]|nr:sel1 repeat family protein [Myxococcales bacterium]